MSRINPLISNTEVIPFVERTSPTEIFGDIDAKFAVGQIGASGGTESETIVLPGYESLFLGYGRLRKNVYADQTSMLPPEVGNEDGTEWDKDDFRSDHLTVVEKVEAESFLEHINDRVVVDDEGFALRVVGAIRVIKKGLEPKDKLPIEEFFPEAFKTGPQSRLSGSVRGRAPRNSCEISRYIARHEDRRTSYMIGSRLIDAAVRHVAFNGLGPTYAVIEPPLERQFQSQRGMPFKRIAEPVYLEEYGAPNLGVNIDSVTMAIWQGIRRQKDPTKQHIEPMTFWGGSKDSTTFDDKPRERIAG